MLVSGWKLGETARQSVTLEDVANHIDHVCQLAGNDRHAVIGTDLDGYFGTEQSASDLDPIANVQKLGQSSQGVGIRLTPFGASSMAIGLIASHPLASAINIGTNNTSEGGSRVNTPEEIFDGIERSVNVCVLVCRKQESY